MKSRISFFNGTALRKDITRFAPVWGLYTVFLLLVLMILGNHGTASGVATTVHNLTGGMAIVNILYAGICAMLLFGDLFNSRMCNALHAFPLRREGWFLTHLTAGILFSLVPNLLTCLLSAFLLQQYFYMALVWLAVTTLQYLFFFGLAAFSALCTGSRFALLVVYAIGNFLSVFVYCIAQTFYLPLLRGVQLELELCAFFSPCIHMAGHQYVEFTKVLCCFGGFVSAQWYYLLGAAAIGLLLMALAVWIYRRRDLENAGDFISLRPLSPVFLLIYTVGVATVMYWIGDLFSEGLKWVFLVIGLTIGFFTGRMLLDRTVKVFHPKAFLAFLALIAVLGLSLVVTRLDPLGITRTVPTLQQVESLRISTSALHPGYDYAYSDDTVTLEDPEDIQAILDIHKTLVRDDTPAGRSVNLYLEYTLTSGMTLSRNYSVPLTDANRNTLNRLFSSPQCVLNADSLEALKASVFSLYFYGDSYIELPQSAHAEVLEALYQDCLEGSAAQNWNFHPQQSNEYSLEIGYYDLNGSRYYYNNVNIYTSCTNTVSVLKQYAASAEK